MEKVKNLSKDQLLKGIEKLSSSEQSRILQVLFPFDSKKNSTTNDTEGERSRKKKPVIVRIYMCIYLFVLISN